MDDLHYDYDKNLPFTLLYSNTTHEGDSTVFERNAFPYYVFEYVLKGAGTVIIDGRIKFTVKQNDIYILPKYYDHKFYSDKENVWQKIFFIIDGPLIEHILQSYNLSNKYLFENCNLKDDFTKMKETFLSVNPRLNHLASSTFLEIVQKLYESGMNNKQQISHDVAIVKDIIDSSICKKIDLNKICAKVMRSKAHIIRKFKEETGNTPYDYLLNKKIELAQKFLRSTSHSIKEIAERLKFADQYYFSGIFKKKTGVSPKNFRINLLKAKR